MRVRLTKSKLFVVAATLLLSASSAFAQDVSSGADSLANLGVSSGTVVGNRAVALRDEVLHVQAAIHANLAELSLLHVRCAEKAVQHHSAVAAIIARLQHDTTKNNPILLRQWEEADASLSDVPTSLNELKLLQSATDAETSVVIDLRDKIQTASELSGAVDEDHDQLKALYEDVRRLRLQLDALRNQITKDVAEQTSYLATERSNLQALALAISRGVLPSSSPVAPPPVRAPLVNAAPVAPSPPSPVEVTASPTEYLLVLIQFNQAHVEYQQQLAQAVRAAIERRPNAEFSVVALSPATGDPAFLATQQALAKNNAEEVKRALIQMGLPSSHITLANTQAQASQFPEVYVYIKK